MSSALEDLGLVQTTATVKDVQRRYRELARVHHPDRGGNAAVFHELKTTCALALEELTDRPCSECHGSGSNPMVMKKPTFFSPRKKCERCGGSGKA